MINLDNFRKFIIENGFSADKKEESYSKILFNNESSYLKLNVILNPDEDNASFELSWDDSGDSRSVIYSGFDKDAFGGFKKAIEYANKTMSISE